MMAICPQQTAFHSLVRPSPQHYQQPLGAPHPCLVEINNNGIVDTIGSQSGAAPVASVLDAHLVHSAIGNGQCPYFSLPTAPYPFPQYQSLYTHAQWTDPRQLQQFQFQPVEPSVPLNQFQSNDHRALTLQAPKSSTPNGHNSESAAAEPFIARAGQFAPQPPATQVHFLFELTSSWLLYFITCCTNYVITITVVTALPKLSIWKMWLCSCKFAGYRTHTINL